MRTAPMIGVDIHFGPDSIRHKYHPGDDKCHAYGVLKIDNGGSTYANLYFDADPAHIDAVIAELVALRAEMAPPAPSGMQDPAPVARVITDGDCWLPLAAGACGDGITGDGEGIACGVAPAGHLRRHEREALPAMGGGTCHWPNLADPETGTEPQHAPVITDSDRTCDQANPDSGAWCHRDGDHGVHRDPDGEEWRTDGEPARVGRLVGTIVADSADDSPCPVTGKIIGQVDEETVEVLWGDRQFEENPGPGRYEPIDMLRSVTA